MSSLYHPTMFPADSAIPFGHTSTEATQVGLSVMTAYYLRKLLQQLKHLGDTGLSVCTLHQRDVNLNAVLHQIYREETEIAAVVLQLENLVYYHSMLRHENRHESTFAPDHIQQLKRLEYQILQCFGIQTGVPTVEG